MMIYKLLLSLSRLLVWFQKGNARQDHNVKSSTPVSELSEASRLIHRLNCITLNDDESKSLHAHLTTILEARNPEKTSENESNCIVLEMSEEEIQKFSHYVGENSSCLFRAIVQTDNNHNQARKLRIIGNHGLRLFNVIVKSHNHKEPEQKYIYKERNHFSIPLSEDLSTIHNTPWMNFQNLSTNDTATPELDIDSLLRVLLENIRTFMGVDTITILLPTENGQQLGVYATIGLEEEILQGIRIPFGSGFAGKIAARGEYMIVDDLSKVEVVSPILRHRGIRSILGVPVVLHNQLNGVLHVGTFSSRKFTKDDVKQLQLLTEHLGLVIEPLFKYGKIISPNEVQFVDDYTKHAEVRTQSPVRIRTKENIKLIEVMELFKKLIYLNLSQGHIC
ncbi:GAF domain-containing protein [Mastigocladus laminosus UU774]|nr:GAF domain-containing protein [Mastigocladus laminosus UU774]